MAKIEACRLSFVDYDYDYYGYGDYRGGYSDPYYDDFYRYEDYYYDYQPVPQAQSRGRGRQSAPVGEISKLKFSFLSVLTRGPVKLAYLALWASIGYSCNTSI